EVQGEGGRLQLRAAGLPRAGQPQGDAVLRRPGGAAAGLLHLRRRHLAQGARGRAGRRPEVGGQLHLQDRQRAHGLPVRGVQGHLPLRPPAGPQGLHHVPLQPGRLPGRAGEGEGPGEHPVPLRAGGRLGGGGQGQRGDRVRRRDPHRRQPVRCPQGRLLRQVLTYRAVARAVPGARHGLPDHTAPGSSEFVPMTTHSEPQEGPMSNGNGVTATLSEDAAKTPEVSTEADAPATTEAQAPESLTGNDAGPAAPAAEPVVERVKKTVATTRAKVAKKATTVAKTAAGAAKKATTAAARAKDKAKEKAAAVARTASTQAAAAKKKAADAAKKAKAAAEQARGNAKKAAKKAVANTRTKLEQAKANAAAEAATARGRIAARGEARKTAAKKVATKKVAVARKVVAARKAAATKKAAKKATKAAKKVAKAAKKTIAKAPAKKAVAKKTVA